MSPQDPNLVHQAELQKVDTSDAATAAPDPLRVLAELRAAILELADKIEGNHILSGSPGPLYSMGWSDANASAARRLRTTALLAAQPQALAESALRQAIKAYRQLPEFVRCVACRDYDEDATCPQCPGRATPPSHPQESSGPTSDGVEA